MNRMKIHIDRERRLEIFRFVITGSIAVTVQYGLYLILLTLCGFNPEVSTAISYLVSFTVNFILSSLYTFRTRPNGRRAFGFAPCHVINITLQITLVWVFSRIVSGRFALLPAMAICVPVNYLLVRHVLTK